MVFVFEFRMVAYFIIGISKIEYKPDGGPGDNLCFKHYNPQEVSFHYIHYITKLSKRKPVSLSFLVF